MVRVSLKRVIALALAGAVGGFISYLLVDPSMRQQEEDMQRQTLQMQDVAQRIQEGWHHVLTLGAVLGIVIGAALILADEIQTRRPGRIVRLILLGALIGGLCGVVGTFCAQLLFSMLLVISVPVMAARTLGWAAMGAAAGLCPGSVARSGQRVRQGILGGLIGGGLGGLLFDTLASITGGGSVSRSVGFTIMGAAIGAAVGLVEEFAKEFWVTALTGAKEGRSFILARDVTILGRNELADIPLFGDPSVQRLHARLLKTGGGVTLGVEPGLMATVNNQPTASRPLADGDILGIGTHRFRFGSRRATTTVALPAGPESGAWQGVISPRPDAAGIPLSPLPYAMPQEGAFSRLEVIAGPHAGASFNMTPGAIIGRDPRCDIALTADTQASRQHARLIPDPAGMGWLIEDGGSTNGLWLNGQRITSSLLQSGDQIGIGNTLFQVILPDAKSRKFHLLTVETLPLGRP